MTALFKDRHHAGALLGKRLKAYLKNYTNPVLILGLPRGGIPIAYEIARQFHAPFDALLVRKLGTPGHEELAMGALASDGIPVFNQHILSKIFIAQHDIQHIVEKEWNELNRRKKLYCQDRAFPDVKNKIVMVVDDGMATGTTMLAAIQIVKSKQPTRIIVAVPVTSDSAYEYIRHDAHEIVYLEKPPLFHAVGEWYNDFTQTTDEEVCALLKQK